MRRTLTRVFVVATVVVSLALLVTPAAFAHEARVIGRARWNVEVGWATEPTYAGYPNAVQFILHDKNDKPVVDLGDTLKVDVSSGGQTTTLSFQPAFEVGGDGTPGDYRANLVPTRPGTYSFRINGTIKGDKISETFACSEKTFDCVKDPQEVQFPAKDPSNSQLQVLIQRETARVAKTANDEVSRAKVLAYVGIGIGIVALGFGFLRGRSPKAGA